MTTTANTFSQTILRKHIALPQDHGSWVFLLSPLLIGLFAAGTVTQAFIPLILGAMSAFLIRQPVTTLIKSFTGRRSRRDIPAALFWASLYALVGLVALVWLVVGGHAYVLWLALPGVPVFAWHLWLVSRRAERRQLGIEIVGSGVLALAAPAAYWVGLGQIGVLGWWLWVLAWFQSAASIVYAYLRLEQRETLKQKPAPSVLLNMGRRSLAYTGFNLIAVLLLSLAGVLPRFLSLPYALQFAETLWGALNPAIGLKPTRIGVRQLIVSILFTVLFIFTWRLS